MKKLLPILLALLLMLTVFSGCSLTEPTQGYVGTGSDAAPSANLDMNAVVAKVGDNEITLSEFKSIYDNYSAMLSGYGYDVTSDPAALEQFQDDIIDMLVNKELISVKAAELGVKNLSAEQQSELNKRIETELDSMHEYFRGLAENEAAQDTTVDIESRIISLIEEEAAYYTGQSMSYDEYIQYTKNAVSDAYYEELLKNIVCADVNVTEDKITERYNELLQADTTNYNEDPAAYKADKQTQEEGGDILILYTPEGYSRVMDILAAPEGEIPARYTEIETELASIKNDYSTLALENAYSSSNSNAEKIKELEEKYKTLKAEADELIKANLQSAKAKIEEAYAKLESGASFTDVLAQYTENTDFTEIEVYKTSGKLISTLYDSESDDDWSNEVKEQFGKLSIGGYSEVFLDDDGYHIISYVKDEPSGNAELSAVKDSISEMLLDELKTEEWNSILETWRNDGTVTLFTDVFRAIGK